MCAYILFYIIIWSKTTDARHPPPPQPYIIHTRIICNPVQTASCTRTIIHNIRARSCRTMRVWRPVPFAFILYEYCACGRIRGESTCVRGIPIVGATRYCARSSAVFDTFVLKSCVQKPLSGRGREKKLKTPCDIATSFLLYTFVFFCRDHYNAHSVIAHGALNSKGFARRGNAKPTKAYNVHHLYTPAYNASRPRCPLTRIIRFSVKSA